MNLNNLEKTFIIAEIGINHDGSLEKLFKMIDVAKECGADAVKLQIMNGYDLVGQSRPYTFGIGDKKNTEDLAEMFYKRRVKKEWLPEIYSYCEDLGIICMATPFSFESVDMLEKVNNPIYKISSGDITHLPLIDYISKLNKPMIISTGKSYISEIDEAVRTIRRNNNNNFSILHCVTSYPTPYDKLNLNVIKNLQQTFQVTAGFSDHSEGYLSSVAAVCLGAKIIEKHFTLDKNSYGPDHWFSLDPAELKDLVENIRLAEKTFGSPLKEVLDVESVSYTRASRSIVAARQIKAGEVFTMDNLTFKRPGEGIAPKNIEQFLGKKARNDLVMNDMLNWNDTN